MEAGGYEIERFTDISDDELDTMLRELQRNCEQQGKEVLLYNAKD